MNLFETHIFFDFAQIHWQNKKETEDESGDGSQHPNDNEREKYYFFLSL